ncbi:hypothetical protein AVEN_40726-1 [Araneus ventricosus]|uniref:Uncharacterized protein n=1 Tax=Araneus ventricosus TaxID=182803 RepID=A0A4Y2NEW7_ARAVE|nr:hypothetical protein AVEN_40726-1 [Araneus ventricosus]
MNIAFWGGAGRGLMAMVEAIMGSDVSADCKCDIYDVDQPLGPQSHGWAQRAGGNVDEDMDVERRNVDVQCGIRPGEVFLNK